MHYDESIERPGVLGNPQLPDHSLLIRPGVGCMRLVQSVSYATDHLTREGIAGQVLHKGGETACIMRGGE